MLWFAIQVKNKIKVSVKFFEIKRKIGGDFITLKFFIVEKLFVQF